MAVIISMDTTTNIRRENLRALVKKEGGVTCLAKKLSKSKSHVSQLSSYRANRGIGTRLAREIESKLSLKTGWMDTPYADDKNNILTKWNKLPDSFKSQLEDYIDWLLEMLSKNPGNSTYEKTDLLILWKKFKQK